MICIVVFFCLFFTFFFIFFFFLMIRRPPRSTLFPYTDALPISRSGAPMPPPPRRVPAPGSRAGRAAARWRSEEHTSELQSRQYLVCRLLLEKKKKNLGARTGCQLALHAAQLPVGLRLPCAWRVG